MSHCVMMGDDVADATKPITPTANRIPPRIKISKPAIMLPRIEISFASKYKRAVLACQTKAAAALKDGSARLYGEYAML